MGMSSLREVEWGDLMVKEREVMGKLDVLGLPRNREMMPGRDSRGNSVHTDNDHNYD